MQSSVRRMRLLSLSLMVVFLSSLLPAPLEVAAQGRTLPKPVSGSRAFVNYRNDGAVGCRDATEQEAQVLRRRAGQSLHVITPARTNRSQNLSAESTGLQIVLRATDQLEDFPAAREAFLNAAARWQALISTPITVVIDVDFGPTWFGERYDENVLGQTDSQTLGDSSIYAEVRNSLVGLGASDDRSGIYSQLPESTVPTDVGSTSYVLAPSAVWRALGFLNPTADPSTEEGDLGDPPAVGFNSDFNYDFEPANGINANSIDFDAVAVHEIGHVLGFSSNTGHRELSRNSPVAVSIWDLFRFRPGATLDTFATAQRILSSGGSQNFFDGTRNIALSTGRPDGTGGDSEQSSHWKDDRLTGQHVGIMDPTLADGQRLVITDNDIAAMRSFGFSVGAATPDTPTITKASYNGKKLKLKGTGFIDGAEVEINGVAIASSLVVNAKGSGKKLEIKAPQNELNIQSGANQVEVIVNGVRSNAFTFTP